MARRFLASLLEVAEIAVITIAAVFFIRTFLVQPFLVSGESMRPNFSDGDYLIIDELTYRLRDPIRGDVVVFRYPNDPSTYFVKRVIGTPGERVVVAGGGVMVYDQQHPDGIALHESYIPANISTNRDGEYVVPDGQYFVLGDNRPFSYDSRSWGFLSRDMIIGVVRFRLWPLAQAAVIPQVQY